MSAYFIQHQGKSYHVGGAKPGLPVHPVLRPAMLSLIPPSARPTHGLVAAPPHLDQGQAGTCVLNAIMVHINAIRIKRGLPPLMLSRRYPYAGTRKREHTLLTEDSGCSIADALQFMFDVGSPEETLFPYDDAPAAIAEDPPEDLAPEAYKHRVNTYFETPTLDAVESAICKGYGVPFAMTLYESYESLATMASGNVAYPKAHEAVLGAHAQWIKGYDRPSKIFRVQGSWGTDCADKGDFDIPYSVVHDFGFEKFTIFETTDLLPSAPF